MGLRFPAQIHGQCFFVTTTFLDWQPFGHIPGMYEKLAASLTFCMDKYGAHILGYVFIPSHIHLLINIDGRHLGSFMRDFKKYIAQKAIKDMGVPSSQIWMPRYDRLVIVAEKVLRSKLNYIHNNPLKAGLVSVPEDWAWSSARAYAGFGDGVLKVFKDWG
jgi:putative transposase